jgi:hypothetical protein
MATEQVECLNDCPSSVVKRYRTSACPVNFQIRTAKAKLTVASRSLLVQEPACFPSPTKTVCDAHDFCCCCVVWPSWHGKGVKSPIVRCSRVGLRKGFHHAVRRSAVIHRSQRDSDGHPSSRADPMMAGKPDLDLDIARSSLQVDGSQTAFSRWVTCLDHAQCVLSFLEDQSRAMSVCWLTSRRQAVCCHCTHHLLNEVR